MTDRLYYEDSHLTEFPAMVTACKQEKDYWKVALDQTAFFRKAADRPGIPGIWMKLKCSIPMRKMEKSGIIPDNPWKSARR